MHLFTTDSAETLDLALELFYFGGAICTWSEALATARDALAGLMQYAHDYDADAERQRIAAGVVLMPEGDMLDAAGMRI